MDTSGLVAIGHTILALMVIGLIFGAIGVTAYGMYWIWPRKH